MTIQDVQLGPQGEPIFRYGATGAGPGDAGFGPGCPGWKSGQKPGTNDSSAASGSDRSPGFGSPALGAAGEFGESASIENGDKVHDIGGGCFLLVTGNKPLHPAIIERCRALMSIRDQMAELYA
jgi:hypothetical protein